MPIPPKNLRIFESFVEIVEALRGPDGCPWDKKQTHASLSRFAIEEACELAEAIDTGRHGSIQDELGDLLLQVVLHSVVARQNSTFNIEDVIESINKKMIRRHPHVFADKEFQSDAEMKASWESIKEKEKQPGKKEGFNLPPALPELLKSHKIGEKTRKQNFDWDDVGQVLEKLDEEILELKEAIKLKDSSEQGKEVGDVLFTVAQVARHLDHDADQCLRQTNVRFENRYTEMQKIATQRGLDFKTLSSEELETLWIEAKKIYN